MLQNKELPWHQKHRKLITLVTITLFVATLFVYGIIHATPTEFTTSFALPASYTLLALIPGYFIVETVGKRLLELKERVDYGLEHKTILLAGDPSECANVEAQLHYSRLFYKKNITNISTEITSPEQAYNSGNFAKYDLVILCFRGENYAPISDQQAQILSEILSNIGDDKRVKNDIKASNSEGLAVGLIILCPLGSLQDPNKKNMLDPIKHKWDTNPFKRPFTVVVNQAGRLLTDTVSLLTTLPPRNNR